MKKKENLIGLCREIYQNLELKTSKKINQRPFNQMSILMVSMLKSVLAYPLASPRKRK